MTSPKSELRKTFLEARRAIAPDDHAAWSLACSRRIYEFIIAHAELGATVAGYLSIQNEVDITPALAMLALRGHSIALPVMDNDTIAFHRWRQGDLLIAGKFGVMEPRGGEAIIPEAIIVPLLAFDRGGNRLGYGRGYYDRALRQLRGENPELLTLGAGFCSQETDAIPVHEGDERLTAIATEKEIIETGRQN